MSNITTVVIHLQKVFRACLIGVIIVAIAGLCWWGFPIIRESEVFIKLKEKEVINMEVTENLEKQTTPTVTIVAENEDKKNKDSFFSEYRIERDRTRSERIDILREIVNNENSSVQMREEAQKKLLLISDNLEKESKVERALMAKGFDDAVVVIQAESVMAIVPAAGLQEEEVVRIADIVDKITGCSIEDLVIVPKSKSENT